MEYIAKSRAKFRKIDNEDSIQFEPKWITAQRGNLFLYEDSLKFGELEISLSSVTEANLLKVTNSPQGGYVLTLTSDTGDTYQFGLENDPIWENQAVLPVNVQTKEIEYSTFSIIYRLILISIVAWLFSRWFISVLPSLQNATINSHLLSAWFISISIVLSYDAVWAYISSHKNIRNLYGIFGSAILYVLSGLLAVILTRSPNPFATGGLTGFIVALVDATLGSFISSRISTKIELPRTQIIINRIFAIMFQIYIGYSLGFFGGGLVK